MRRIERRREREREGGGGGGGGEEIEFLANERYLEHFS